MPTPRPGLLAAATVYASLSLSPAPAAAFCGFFVSGADADLYSNASQVALLRQGTRTAMTMSNNYKGPPQDFAMVVPVPVVLQKEQVKTLSPDVFRHIDQLSAPRLVEYWEQDPCYVPPPMRHHGARAGLRYEKSAPAQKSDEGDLGVKIEAKFEVGEYQVLILSAQESGGLEKWLHLNKYKIPQGAAAALAPYIRDQMKFFVAKVDIQKVHRDSHGLVVLSPLRFTFDSQELRLPVRLGLLNALATQDLIVYILHPTKRFEVANYKNVFIPTNIEVADSVRKGFGEFYADLFDESLRRSGPAVVTEYAWQTTSCDPCPTPPLDQQDLFVLGADGPGPAGDKPPGTAAQPGAPYYGQAVPYVLTRLHTRYDRKTLTEDLIFREAGPVVGGRSGYDGTAGDQGAQPGPQGSDNNFQGRYIIRHYWDGAVACKEPRYGVWGGPPGSGYSRGGGGKPQVAQDLANVPRGEMKLGQVVYSPLPSLGLAGKAHQLRPGEKR